MLRPYLRERRNVVPGSLAAIIRSFKSAATQRINTMRNTPGIPMWQRNYYEHVIRTEDEWNEIRTYIAENPSRWKLDENHPRQAFLQEIQEG